MSREQQLEDALRAIWKAHEVVALNGGAGWTRHIEPAIYAAAKLLKSPAPPRWRHKKRQTTYTEVGRGKLQVMTDAMDMEPLVIYRCEEDGSLWARPVSEFEDGRFERLA